MNVEDLMTREIRTCGPNDSLSFAAQIMWDNDCGSVPVVDGEGKVIAMVTDRDICMAAYTQGRLLRETPVHSAASRAIFTIRNDDRIEAVETLMRDHRIRRVPVVDAQGRLVGIVSMKDLARHVHSGHPRADGLSADKIAKTLAAVSEPHAARDAAA